MAEKDTQKLKKNLGNVQELVERFEEKYSKRVRQVKKNNIRKSKKGELLGKYIAKLLQKQNNKRFNREYWKWLERNWKRQKEKRKLETV